jgi:DNA-3-methyladenine glycosylase II
MLLKPMRPFDFTKSLSFLGEFTPAQGEQNLEVGRLTKATRIEDKTFAFQIRSVDNGLECKLYGEQAPKFEAALADRIRFYLSLDDDLQPFYALAENDPPFFEIVHQLNGYHQVKFLTAFENACWAILSTRTPMSAALGAKKRLIDNYGGQITVEGVEYYAFPEPTDLQKAPLAELTELLQNERRAEYILSVVEAFIEVDEEWLKKGETADVRDWLLNIRGIGPWAASFILIRGLGRMEILDAPEKRLIEAASQCYQRPLTEHEVLQIAEQYGQYRGYWAHYLRAAQL